MMSTRFSPLGAVQDVREEVTKIMGTCPGDGVSPAFFRWLRYNLVVHLKRKAWLC